ncbi:MAG TPA: DUF4157 domain-containing protein, partial [Cyclobacteriaceae bacterium]|nr:DUF4157 domain-containing protein [Cyclobacteriaceae bacterium]
MFTLSEKTKTTSKAASHLLIQKGNSGAHDVSNTSTPFIQPKLTIGAPDDVYEKEADAMSDKVMRMQIPEPINFSSTEDNIKRKCDHCEEEEKQLLKKGNSSDSCSLAPPIVNDVINSSSGKSLDADTRSYMEPRFNYDFGNVKIHDNNQAAESADSINALAYTSGHNVVFNKGQYNPSSDSGKRLLAHELTHVVQQGSKIQKKIIQRSADTCTYGEIREWAIVSMQDHSAPAGLADAKASIGAACSRGQSCNCVNGSNASADGNKAAWTNITTASGGTDQSNGGNFMCVGSEACGFVHQCRPIYQKGQPVPPKRE